MEIANKHSLLRNRNLFLEIVLALFSATCGDAAPQAAAASDVWRKVWGTHESQYFRLEDGKGMAGECTPIVSRSEWVIEEGRRVYILYEVEPGNLELDGFHYIDEEAEEFQKGYRESLWIGLLGENGEIIRKKRLGTGLQNISGIQKEADGYAYVTAQDVQGRTRIIMLKYPLPWPPLEQKGSAWNRYNERLEREINRIAEDWPGNASGYAAQWQANGLQPFLEKERRQAVGILLARPMSKLCRACLEEEPNRTWVLAWEATEGVADQSYNVHWGQVVASESRDRFIYPYLRNWLEGGDHPDGWRFVCNARGEFNGESFTATNGVALVGMDGWNKRASEGEEIERWGLLRLAPERVCKEDGKTFVEFELIMPQFMDSAWKAGHGRFVEEGGTLHLQNLTICLDFPWLRGVPGVTVED